MKDGRNATYFGDFEITVRNGWIYAQNADTLEVREGAKVEIDGFSLELREDGGLAVRHLEGLLAGKVGGVMYPAGVPVPAGR